MALPLKTFIGQEALQVAQQLQPRMVLTVYDHSVIMRKRGPRGGMMEFAIDPSALASLLTTQVEFSTGLLSPNTLFVHQKGAQRTVVEYRPPEVTGLWLEGSEAAIRVPLPGLILIRVYSGGSPTYRVFAVKSRPQSLDVPLFNAPLPNVSDTGVCWGTVAMPSAEALAGTSLAEDWRQFLGSRFGNHTTEGKSQKHKDIRGLYVALEGKKRYPLNDLVAAKTTLGSVLGANNQ